MRGLAPRGGVRRGAAAGTASPHVARREKSREVREARRGECHEASAGGFRCCVSPGRATLLERPARAPTGPGAVKAVQATRHMALMGQATCRPRRRRRAALSWSGRTRGRCCRGAVGRMCRLGREHTSGAAA